MSKWMLQQRIRNCENKIEENRQEIIKLENRIESFYQEINKLSTIQGQVESYFDSKRIKCETLQQSVRGCASRRAMDKSVDAYSVANCNVHLDELENIKTHINININKTREMIGELGVEINALYSTISSCRREIADIEREEEERNAGLNYI